MYGQKYGRKLVKPLRIEKNRKGQKKSQNLTKLYFIDPDDKAYSEIPENARRKLEILMATAMPCKRMDKQHPTIVKANAEPKNVNGKESKTVYRCVVESHKSTRQREEEKNLFQ